jgi:RNA polymerase sigma-70 factor (ECF subfamily)
VVPRLRHLIAHHPVVVTTTGGPGGPVPSPTHGDPLAEVLDRYAGRALALARRIVADDALAEDVVQEALLAYWRRPSAYDPARGAFGPWLLALVHHKAVDAVRRETAQQRIAAAAVRGAVLQPASAPDTADLVADRTTAGSVRSAVTALPPAQRDAILLAYWGGLTQREIAQHTGTPLGTVKTRMLAGMRRLHAALDTAVPAPRQAAG